MASDVKAVSYSFASLTLTIQKTITSKQPEKTTRNRRMTANERQEMIERYKQFEKIDYLWTIMHKWDHVVFDLVRIIGRFVTLQHCHHRAALLCNRTDLLHKQQSQILHSLRQDNATLKLTLDNLNQNKLQIDKNFAYVKYRSQSFFKKKKKTTFFSHFFEFFFFVSLIYFFVIVLLLLYDVTIHSCDFSSFLRQYISKNKMIPSFFPLAKSRIKKKRLKPTKNKVKFTILKKKIKGLTFKDILLANINNRERSKDVLNNERLSSGFSERTRFNDENEWDGNKGQGRGEEKDEEREKKEERSPRIGDDENKAKATQMIIRKCQQQLLSKDENEHLIGAHGIRQLLSSVDKEPPFESILNSGIVPRLIFLMKDSSRTMLRQECTWSVANIASGPSVWIAQVCKLGAIQAFLHALTHSNDIVTINAAILGLANIAGDCTQYRDWILQ
ncbi:hypothetical protein RFI_24012, partial [Reticulomyxa filosa]